MTRYTIEVNGKRLEADTPAERPLLDVLREDFGLTGTKYGCGEGQCRACGCGWNGTEGHFGVAENKTARLHPGGPSVYMLALNRTSRQLYSRTRFDCCDISWA